MRQVSDIAREQAAWPGAAHDPPQGQLSHGTARPQLRRYNAWNRRLASARHRRPRAAGATVALVAIYYLLPPDRSATWAAVTMLAIGLGVLIRLAAFQVRSITG